MLSCLIRGTVSLKAMWTNMVICVICKFLYCPVKRFFCMKFVQFYAFIFLRVKLPLHRRIIVRISSFAHALGYMGGFTEFYKRFWCVLGTLIAVQDQSVFNLWLCIQWFLQRTDRKVAANAAIGYAGNNTPVMQVNNVGVYFQTPYVAFHAGNQVSLGGLWNAAPFPYSYIYVP